MQHISAFTSQTLALIGETIQYENASESLPEPLHLLQCDAREVQEKAEKRKGQIGVEHASICAKISLPPLGSEERMRDFQRKPLKQSEIEADRKIREKTYKHAMFCSICGSSMVLRRNKLTREEFYGCSRYPACNGTDQIEYKPEEKTGFLNPVESLTKRSHDQPRQPQHTSHRGSDELNRRWKEIVLLAEQKCGSSSQAAIWLETPKISFRGRKPMDLLGTLEGCDRVESMLNEL